MLDDDVRAQLADWVAPLAELPVPDIRVLRRRTWRRRMRWGGGTMAAAAAVAAVVAIGILPGPGRPSIPAGGNQAAPPGTWYAGRWFAAGPPPAADASPAAAPYVVTISGGREVVTDALTGAVAGTAGPPSGSFAGVAAAGDDHTFVLAARGGASVSFYEQRLGPAGRPGSPVLVFTLPASSVPAFALSPDASLLAFAMPGGIAVVSLATGAGRSWTASGGEVVGLSWAGDRALALTWAPVSAGQIRSLTVRLLATTAPGTSLMASQPLLPVCANSAGLLCLEQDPMGAADGSNVFVADQFNGTGTVVADVEEFSGRTRRTVFSAQELSGTPSSNAACAVLWTDPAGEQLVIYCGHWITVEDGRARPTAIHVLVSQTEVQDQLLAW
jgi:hypothetical protein